LSDGGVEWKDIQCAFGGSMQAGTAESLLRLLGALLLYSGGKTVKEDIEKARDYDRQHGKQ